MWTEDEDATPFLDSEASLSSPVVCTSHRSSVELGFPERTQCQLCSMLCSKHLESCLADREHDADKWWPLLLALRCVCGWGLCSPGWEAR